jgi:hypothetical protein
LTSLAVITSELLVIREELAAVSGSVVTPAFVPA